MKTQILEIIKNVIKNNPSIFSYHLGLETWKTMCIECNWDFYNLDTDDAKKFDEIFSNYLDKK